MYEPLPEVVLEVIGRVVAEERKSWVREREHIEAEARATIAEQRAEIAELRAQTTSMMAELTATTRAALLEVEKAMSCVKDGRDGEAGPQGQQGEQGIPGQDADPETVAEIVLAKLPPPQKGDPGQDADPMLIAEMVKVEVQRELNSWHRPVDGKDADPEAVAELVLQRLPKPKDGEKGDKGDRGDDVDMDLVAVMIEEATQQAISQWPVPKDGKDAEPELIRSMVCEEVAKWPEPQPGRDGKDADPDVIRQMVKEAAAQLPPPEKGEKGERGEKGIGIDWLEIMDGDLYVKWSDDDEGPQGLGRVVGERGERGQDADPELTMKLVHDAVTAVAKEIRVPLDGKDGRDGKDGVGLAGLVIDRAGCCIATMTDGSIRELGLIVGKDGAPGRDGVDGKDGAPGIDGRDGLSIEDLFAEFDGDRTLTLRFARGDIVKTIPVHLPVPIYRGFWDEKATYEFGDGVSFGGSLWLAQKDTNQKPSTNCEDWRLAVKAGRDGRDGKPGEKGERGLDGRPGKDFVAGKS